MTAGLATAKEISSDPLVFICTEYHFLLSKEYLEEKKETSPAAFLSGEDALRSSRPHVAHNHMWASGCSLSTYISLNQVLALV